MSHSLPMQFLVDICVKCTTEQALLSADSLTANVANLDVDSVANTIAGTMRGGSTSWMSPTLEQIDLQTASVSKEPRRGALP